jgi:hypothetical protein
MSLAIEARERSPGATRATGDICGQRAWSIAGRYFRLRPGLRHERRHRKARLKWRTVHRHDPPSTWLWLHDLPQASRIT